MGRCSNVLERIITEWGLTASIWMTSSSRVKRALGLLLTLVALWFILLLVGLWMIVGKKPKRRRTARPV